MSYFLICSFQIKDCNTLQIKKTKLQHISTSLKFSQDEEAHAVSSWTRGGAVLQTAVTASGSPLPLLTLLDFMNFFKWYYPQRFLFLAKKQRDTRHFKSISDTTKPSETCSSRTALWPYTHSCFSLCSQWQSLSSRLGHGGPWRTSKCSISFFGMPSWHQQHCAASPALL